MGKRELIFQFRLNAAERALIANLAKRLQRNQSDAVRFIVMSAIRALEEEKIKEHKIGAEGDCNANKA